MKVVKEVREFYGVDEVVRGGEIGGSRFYYDVKGVRKGEKYGEVKKGISEIYEENRGG